MRYLFTILMFLSVVLLSCTKERLYEDTGNSKTLETVRFIQSKNKTDTVIIPLPASVNTTLVH